MEDRLDMLFQEFRAWKKRMGKGYELAVLIVYSDESGIIAKNVVDGCRFDWIFPFASIQECITKLHDHSKEIKL